MHSNKNLSSQVANTAAISANSTPESGSQASPTTPEGGNENADGGDADSTKQPEAEQPAVAKAEPGAATNAKGERIDSIDLTGANNWSQRILRLNKAGFTTGAIAKFLSMHPDRNGKPLIYQHARNIIHQDAERQKKAKKA